MGFSRVAPTILVDLSEIPLFQIIFEIKEFSSERVAFLQFFLRFNAIFCAQYLSGSRLLDLT